MRRLVASFLFTARCAIAQWLDGQRSTAAFVDATVDRDFRTTRGFRR